MNFKLGRLVPQLTILSDGSVSIAGASSYVNAAAVSSSADGQILISNGRLLKPHGKIHRMLQQR